MRELKPREWDDVAKVAQLARGGGLDLEWGCGTSKPLHSCPVCPSDQAAHVSLPDPGKLESPGKLQTFNCFQPELPGS